MNRTNLTTSSHVPNIPNSGSAQESQERVQAQANAMVEVDLLLQMQERIASLEKELVQTNFELACARSSEENLKLELAIVRSGNSATSLAFDDNESAAFSEALVVPTTDPFSRKKARRRRLTNTPTNRPNVRTVPTSDPFSRKKAQRARRLSAKALNPGSCASALNLLALASQDSLLALAAQGSAASLRGSGGGGLNPGSCASGINLLALMASSSSEGCNSQFNLLQQGRDG